LSRETPAKQQTRIIRRDCHKLVATSHVEFMWLRLLDPSNHLTALQLREGFSTKAGSLLNFGGEAEYERRIVISLLRDCVWTNPL